MQEENNNNPFLQVVLNPDGTLSRPPLPLSPPSAAVADSPVFSKDVPLNPAHNTRLRIYIPRTHLNQTSTPHEKLPIIVFYHGGGFILFSSDFFLYHSFCESLAAHLPAVVVSLDYRLAPEFPLPAAYDDAVEAVHWLRHSAAEAPLLPVSDPLRHADFSRCFLMGSSSGGNMVYHAGLRLSDIDLRPVTIAGLVMNQPFFGGAARTESELEMEDDPVLPLRATDMMWRVSLPKGADRDHEFCNPMKAAASAAAECKLPRCMVSGNGGDPLIDRQKVFVRMMEAAGVSVVVRMEGGGTHAAEIMDPETARALIDDVRRFMDESGRDSAVTPP